MAKALANLAMFYNGDPSEGSPTNAFMSYAVVDGTMRKDHQTHLIDGPSWTDSPNTIWDAAVTQIKTNEGIS